MTTQYKWLPEQPTDEMIQAAYTGDVPHTYNESTYKVMWQATPVVEQEPAAIVRRYRDGTVVAEIRDKNMDEGTELYTHPPKREPLSEEEVLSLALKHTSENHEGFPIFDCYGFASEIEKPTE